MNPIFPTKPAKVNVHLVPPQAEFLSYFVEPDTFTLRAWMPDNFANLNESSSVQQEYDRFYRQNCVGCERNCRNFYETNHPELFYDPEEYGYLDSIASAVSAFVDEDNGDCAVYWEGFRGQQCPMGNVFEAKPPTHDKIANMVFDIKLTHGKTKPRFKKYTDNAHLKAGYVDESGQIYETTAKPAANVYTSSFGYDPGYVYGKICWNNITNHLTLRDIVTSYTTSKFNNDLLRISAFESYISETRESMKYKQYEKSNHKFLASGYDSLILIDADKDVQAFFTMLMAGFTPLPELPHIMVVPAKTATIKKGEMIYLGYATQEDAVGRSWYISTEGFLIGQLDESFVTV